jgi:hypothetical protein
MDNPACSGHYPGPLFGVLPAQHWHAAKILLSPCGLRAQCWFSRSGVALLRQGRTRASRRSAADDPMVVPNHRCGSTRFPGLLCSCLLASACSLGLSTSGRQISLICPFDGLFLLPFVVLPDLGTQLYGPVTRAALFTPLPRRGLLWCPRRGGCPCNGHRVDRNCLAAFTATLTCMPHRHRRRGWTRRRHPSSRAEAWFRVIVSLVKLDYV